SLMFEVRVAYALHRLGFSAEYEHQTGAGTKSADFRVRGDRDWLIELVSLGVTDAVKAATRQEGPLVSLDLNSNAKDRKQSEEGELIKAIERIADKATKFGRPSSAMHMILV